MSFAAVAIVAVIVSSCSGSVEGDARLSAAELLMEERPDSALALLREIDDSSIGSKKERARYSLLMSMALDKNYIDTTVFDVLRPAMDYYLKHGSPDEKLKTYYYRGRIFQNQGDRDNALNSFVKGMDEAANSEDSLYVARTLVAQACLYLDFYDFESYTENYLKAAEIYKNLYFRKDEFYCLLNSLNGVILLGNKVLGDSIMNLCDNFEELDNEQYLDLVDYKLSYALKFKSEREIKDLIAVQEGNGNLDMNGLLTLAFAYNEVGENNKAKILLDNVRNSGNGYDTIKHTAIFVSVLEGLGDYENSLQAYKDFTKRLDSIDALKFEQKAQLMNEKHRIELKAQNDARKKNSIIWSCMGGIVLLVFGVVILFQLIRSNKQQKRLAFQRAKMKELENENLIKEKNLAIEKAKATGLENEKLKVESDLAIEKAKATGLENEKLKAESDLAIEKTKATELENKKLKAESDLAIEKAKATGLENEKLKAESNLAIEKAKATELENERLKAENELAIEKAKAAELENEKLKAENDLAIEREKVAKLESENLAHRVEVLENEGEALKHLLEIPNELPSQALASIKIRIEMLNSLLAGYITDNERYKKPYDTWVKELTENSEEFMNSNRLAFRASHPGFIRYFEKKGLTIDEINYVCLYAIGLRGKEVGSYMKKRSHVNISSGIRKKLGIDKHETNIGIYVRKLLKEK